jgi:hypothetical protein
MRIHSEDLKQLKELAEAQARGRPPIDGGTFLRRLEHLARDYPQTFLELIRHIEAGEPLTPGPYE